MTNELIDRIYEELKRVHSCKSRSEFSRRWLGREESYYRSVQAKNASISFEAQAHLAARLQRVGMIYQEGRYPWLIPKGDTLLELHRQCLENLLRRAILNGIDAPSEFAADATDTIARNNLARARPTNPLQRIK